MNKQGWEIKKLGEIATYINGYAFKPIDWGTEGLPIIRIQNLNSSSASYNYTIKSVDKKYIVNEGDVLISWSASLGVYEWLGFKAVLNQHIFKVVFDKVKVDKKFFKYQIDKKITEMLKHIHGATMKHITKKNFDNISFSLPPTNIQNQIVKELDTLQVIITKKKAQLEELDTLAQATFYDMFGDPVENEKGWDIHKLEQFYKKDKNAVKCGPFGSALRKEEYTSHGIPVWNMDNISKNGDFNSSVRLWISPSKFKELESYSVINGDIIISRAGTVGKMCVVSSIYSDSIISTNLIRLRLNNQILPLFFVKAMTFFGQKICRLKVGEDGSFTHMNTGILNNIIIPTPPLPLQNQFAKQIEAIEKQKALINQSIAETQLLFDSAMDNYFN